MVVAKQMQFVQVLKGTHQLRVPMYQRRYSWRKPEWDALFDDVVRLAIDRRSASDERHFIGSVVLAAPNGAAATSRLVIDGQQRLVTISLLLCAVRDAGEPLPLGVRQRINGCLARSGHTGDPFKRLRVLPTELDQDDFSRVVNAQVLTTGQRTTLAYQHFARRLIGLVAGEDEGDDVDDVSLGEFALAALDGLECVQIKAQPADNVHRIFESLNNRGMELTQSDLIRNYVFMRLDKGAEYFHRYTWTPLEKRFTADELTQLFWLDLVRERPTITQRQTYVEQQKRMHGKSASYVRKSIERIAERADYWDRILHPDKEVQSVKVKHRLQRLRDWQTTTVWPVLMYLLERRATGLSNSTEIARAMQYLESYFVRRVVMGRATMNMNRVLLSAPAVLAKSDLSVDVALRHYLSEEGKHWASDDELRREVVSKAFYNHGKGHQKTLILKWIEESLGDMQIEFSEELTVEHVMPQKLTPAWKDELKHGASAGQDLTMLHAQLVHTLGNLTLTRRNSEMSNKSFLDKKQILRKFGSNLKLTSEITVCQLWSPDRIRDRSVVMVERIIRNWPGPVDV